MFALGQLLAPFLSRIFVSYDGELMAMTLRGFRIFSFSFLFAGPAIFGSGFFTALNNGPVSAAISFLRTLVFQMAAILLLPLVWEVDGIWASVVVAELMAAAASLIFMYVLRKRYKY
jgi:Na+-driven multidrug efflux pump